MAVSLAAATAADLGARIYAAVREGHAPDIHGVVVIQDGRLVVERYFEGPDEGLGRPLGRIAFEPGTLHDLRSVTKSIVGLLYGIALHQGKVPAPDAPLLAQFPEYADLAAEPARRRLTVGHALTMTLGLEWDESIPYSDPANSERAMEAAADRHRFTLERQIVAEPGRTYRYNGGASALLALLISKGTGRDLEDFARAALFDPIGIGRTEWHRGRDGLPLAAAGLRMTPRDLARIGRLVLDGGRWDGKPVVPAVWLRESFKPHVAIEGDRFYGYHWYVSTTPRRQITAIGNGGQRLFVLPDQCVAVAIAAGAYNRPDQSKAPLALLNEVVLPSLRG